MKAGLLSIIALSALAAAQPHADHRRFHKRHQPEYKVEYETDVVTAYAPAVTVYVDSNGVPCDSNGQPISSAAAPAPAAQTPAPAPKAPAYSPTPQPAAPAPQPPAPAPAPEPAAPAPQPAAPAPQPAAPAPQPPAPAPEPAAPAPHPSSPAPKPAPSYQSPSPSGGSSGLGVTYSVYQPNGAPCKDQSQVDEDVAKIFQNGDYAMIRTYGPDCQQTSKVANAIKKAGKNAKLFVTLLQISNIEQECQQLVADMNGDWSAIDTIAVGNELVNDGLATPALVKAAIATAKGCLTGYNGKIVTVDTFVAIIAHPELCDAGDYVAANCHPFFDGSVLAPDAGQWVLEQAQRVSQACGGKKVVISETGWPHQGSPNKLAVPSPENQQAAISSIKSKFTDNLFIFSAFDELWKENNGGTFGCEKYWGFIN